MQQFWRQTSYCLRIQSWCRGVATRTVVVNLGVIGASTVNTGEHPIFSVCIAKKDRQKLWTSFRRWGDSECATVVVGDCNHAVGDSWRLTTCYTRLLSWP